MDLQRVDGAVERRVGEKAVARLSVEDQRRGRPRALHRDVQPPAAHRQAAHGERQAVVHRPEAQAVRPDLKPEPEFQGRGEPGLRREDLLHAGRVLVVVEDVGVLDLQRLPLGVGEDLPVRAVDAPEVLERGDVARAVHHVPVVALGDGEVLALLDAVLHEGRRAPVQVADAVVREEVVLHERGDAPDLPALQVERPRGDVEDVERLVDRDALLRLAVGPVVEVAGVLVPEQPLERLADARGLVEVAPLARQLGERPHALVEDRVVERREVVGRLAEAEGIVREHVVPAHERLARPAHLQRAVDDEARERQAAVARRRVAREAEVVEEQQRVERLGRRGQPLLHRGIYRRCSNI